MYRAYLFDLDGTIYIGDELLPGAAETIARLRDMGRSVVFLSNNPTKTRAQYAAKLSGMGIPTTVEDVINSSFVLAQWLLQNAPAARLFVVGEDALKSDLVNAGFRLTEQALETDIVVASFDRAFDYRKLQIAFDAIRAGARLVGTNPDRYCPVPGGGEPDAAAMIAAIEACTGARCDPIVGKPSPIMVKTALALLSLAPQDCIMVGDRIETDIKMAIDAGMATCLVLSGDADRAKLAISGLEATYVFERIDGLLNVVAEADEGAQASAKTP